MQVVQVDDIGLQTLQGVFTGLANGFGAAVNDTHQFAIAIHIHTGHAALAGQGELLTVRFEHFADQSFIGAKTVKCSSVKKCNACI